MRTIATFLSYGEAAAPRLIFSRSAWNKLYAYVHVVGDAEINGFAYVTVRGGDFYVMSEDNVFITSQTVTLHTADAGGNSFAKAQYFAGEEGRGDDLRLQWHSHVRSDAYFSEHDLSSIDNFGRAGMDWFLSLVTNQFGGVVARFDNFNTGQDYAISVIVLDVINDTAISEEVAAKVTIEEFDPEADASAYQPARRTSTVIGANRRTA